MQAVITLPALMAGFVQLPHITFKIQDDGVLLKVYLPAIFRYCCQIYQQLLAVHMDHPT
ncbi:hypothetical protein [Photorhabdus heterorhabditis]|uniref:hypothetical protein n=1 Tax=Photorhabdus heterorhabditis TaxID=880156 RepID=UPI0013791615|nr:hypothetical protein [Photorhabdus heterorhabditis]